MRLGSRLSLLLFSIVGWEKEEGGCGAVCKDMLGKPGIRQGLMGVRLEVGRQTEMAVVETL